MIADFCARHGIPVLRNLPLCRYTTFRIGGCADVAVSPDSAEKLCVLIRFLNENDIRYFVLGRGSDILASDAGYRGVIVLTEGLKELSCDGNQIRAGAGCSMASVSNLALKNSLAGLEFLHGIPGSVGGGVFMNAGAYGSEISRFIKSVDWVDEDGRLHTSSANELDFSYRHSYFSDHFGVVCSVVFFCEYGDSSEIRVCMNDLDCRRREKQPLEYPSAGSTFKRPEGYFAGKLIEDCGLKGFSVGDACVSEKHAGFIVNKGNATSADVRRLIDHIVDTVQVKTGVVLEPEIRFLSE